MMLMMKMLIITADKNINMTYYYYCGMAGPLGSVPGMWNHLQGDQVN